MKVTEIICGPEDQPRPDTHSACSRLCVGADNILRHLCVHPSEVHSSSGTALVENNNGRYRGDLAALTSLGKAPPQLLKNTILEPLMTLCNSEEKLVSRKPTQTNSGPVSSLKTYSESQLQPSSWCFSKTPPPSWSISPKEMKNLTKTSLVKCDKNQLSIIGNYCHLSRKTIPPY